MQHLARIEGGDMIEKLVLDTYSGIIAGGDHTSTSSAPKQTPGPAGRCRADPHRHRAAG